MPRSVKNVTTCDICGNVKNVYGSNMNTIWRIRTRYDRKSVLD